MLRPPTVLLLICALAAVAVAAETPAAKADAKAPATPNTLTAARKAAGWKMLFNGKDIKDWVVKSGQATYTVEDGAIVGTTKKGSPNSFLTTKETFRDFELTFEVLLDSPELNSGVQIRSKLRGTKFGGRVYGPQVEIEKSPGQSGFIYGEAAGGWQSPEPKSRNKAVSTHKHFLNGKWNTYRILAVGRKIQTFINGKKVADLLYNEQRYKDNPEGIIGLQVHGVGKRGPYTVRWRSIYIKKLAPTATEAKTGK